MAINPIQMQKGLSLPKFQAEYGTEAQCEDALRRARWPDGFRCPACQGERQGICSGHHPLLALDRTIQGLFAGHCRMAAIASTGCLSSSLPSMSVKAALLA